MLLLQLHALALWAALVSSQVFNTTLSSSVLVSQRTDAPAAQSHPSSSSMPSTSASTVSFSSTLPAPSPAPTLLLDSNRPTPTSNGNANPDAIWIPSPPANGSNVYVPFAIEAGSSGMCISFSEMGGTPSLSKCAYGDGTLGFVAVTVLDSSGSARGLAKICLAINSVVCLDYFLVTGSGLLQAADAKKCVTFLTMSALNTATCDSTDFTQQYTYHALSSFQPIFCGSPSPAPTQGLAKLLPQVYTQGFMGGNANLVFQYNGEGIYGQVVSFAPATATAAGGLPAPTACVPTIVGWDTTYQSSTVTSTMTSVVTQVGGEFKTISFPQPVLKPVGTPVSGCFFSATIAQTASCFSTTLTSTNVAGATETFVYAYGSADVEAKVLGSSKQASNLYPFTLLYPFKASSITIPVDPFSVTFLIVSQSFTLSGNSTGTLQFTVSGTTSDVKYIVAVMTSTSLNGGNTMTGVIDPNARTNYNFTVPITCGNSETYTVMAQLCQSDFASPPSCSSAISTIPYMSQTFQLDIDTTSVSNCGVTLSIQSSYDVTATVTDVVTGNNTLRAYDVWQIQLRSTYLQQAAIFINVESVMIHTVSDPTTVIELDPSCFTRVTTGYGLNIFTFPANVLNGVSSYSMPPDLPAYWFGNAALPGHPTQSCFNGGFLLNRSETYQFQFRLYFNNTEAPGSPLRRRSVPALASAGNMLPGTINHAGAGLWFDFDPAAYASEYVTPGEGGLPSGRPLSGGAVAGIVVATILVVAGTVGLIYWKYSARKAPEKEKAKLNGEAARQENELARFLPSVSSSTSSAPAREAPFRGSVAAAEPLSGNPRNRLPHSASGAARPETASVKSNHGATRSALDTASIASSKRRYPTESIASGARHKSPALLSARLVAAETSATKSTASFETASLASAQSLRPAPSTSTSSNPAIAVTDDAVASLKASTMDKGKLKAHTNGKAQTELSGRVTSWRQVKFNGSIRSSASPVKTAPKQPPSTSPQSGTTGHTVLPGAPGELSPNSTFNNMRVTGSFL